MTASHQNKNISETADTRKSVHLSASAGSGKTRALKERYLALLANLDKNGLHFDQAVAITFTDKAAAEIKKRVMNDLPETMLKKIIHGTQDLRISTIHSFCMNLLKQYPLEAGLPPDFGILDSRDQAYKIKKAVEDALEDSTYTNDPSSPLSTFSIDELVEKITYLLSIRSRLKRIEIDAGGPEGLLQTFRQGMSKDADYEEILALVSSSTWRNAFQTMEKLLASAGDGYFSCRGAEHAALASVQAPETTYDIARAVFPIYFTAEDSPRKKPPITAKAFVSMQKHREYESLFFQIQDFLANFKKAYLRIHASDVSEDIIKLYLLAEEKYRESKLREGLLDFDDLEISAYRLLQGAASPDILYWLDRKILHFLVDEFQDTSDIQWAIIHKLTEELFAGMGTDKPMPPTLFIVGDEKQSIYRFREANYRLIHDVRTLMEERIPREAREVLSLEKNYRSTPEIIGTVNQVFSGLWNDLYIPAEAVRKTHAGSVRIIEIPKKRKTQTVSFNGEPEIIALEISKMIATGTPVYEQVANFATPPHRENRLKQPIQTELFPASDEDWRLRPAGYGDCAILIQSRTRLKEYEAALQSQGIPYRVVGGIGFYEEIEIQAIINILFYLWNHDDVLSLFSALKSPLFGLHESDIARMVLADHEVPHALKQQYPEVWRMLSRWTEIARLVPLAGLIHRIVDDSCAYVKFGKINQQAIFNIDKLLDTAGEFDRRGYTTLQDFVEWIRNIRDTEQREATSDMNLPGFEGSVSILTVHKAKGLEYPIVFLPGIDQASQSLTIGPEALVLEDMQKNEEVRRRMAVRSACNPVYEELWTGEQQEYMREYQRLLYVAMTRARDHLIMSGTLSTGKTSAYRKNTWLDFLHKTLPLENHEVSSSEIITYSFPGWQQEALTVNMPLEHPALTEQIGIISADTKNVGENISPLPSTKTPEWKKVTDVLVQKDEGLLDIYPGHHPGAGVSALTRGSVMHRCLQEFTIQGAYDLDKIISEFSDLPASDSTEGRIFIADVQSVLESVLQKEDFSWIFSKKDTSYSELPFLLKKDLSLISGVIDRIIIQEKTGFIIDYKAIQIKDEEDLALWIDHYRPQVQIYCAAAKEIFRLDTVEGYLFFLDSHRLQLISKL